MEENVTFQSDGLTLTGVVHIPDDIQPGERRPAVMVLHGFGSKKESNNCTGPCKMLADWGYIAMRFDFRGCGESEGEYGRLICLEQVSDTWSSMAILFTKQIKIRMVQTIASVPWCLISMDMTLTATLDQITLRLNNMKLVVMQI